MGHAKKANVLQLFSNRGARLYFLKIKAAAQRRSVRMFFEGRAFNNWVFFVLRVFEELLQILYIQGQAGWREDEGLFQKGNIENGKLYIILGSNDLFQIWNAVSELEQGFIF